jgi:hypothetical protein
MSRLAFCWHVCGCGNSQSTSTGRFDFACFNNICIQKSKNTFVYTCALITMNVKIEGDPIQAQQPGGNNRPEDFNRRDQSSTSFGDLTDSEKELLVRVVLLIQTLPISKLFVQAV